MRQSFISWKDYMGLHLVASLDKVPFAPPYSHSAKEPDRCVIPGSSKVPTIVVEAGWSESRSQLHEDMKLWLTGGRPDVQLVIVLKWTKGLEDRVEGDVEVFERDASGSPRSVQRETVYPTPAHAAQQAIRITKRHLWGRHLPAGYDGNEGFDLSLDLLREIALRALHSQGCSPA
ncbi:hypothetical protein PISL3812_06817 [Talaromyces islandicus]|uniref:Uncharacterized protein n=1 Tax=Talaromyces islandicus TaxID=28573 RepID=A0A0U1M2H0_TALIS|nr:hypothetical protein PISL3812_06817 [Talaromyces islandicus]